MSSAITLFISHAWDHANHYDDLVDLLNSMKELTWFDVSITKEKAISIATGQDELPQRRQLVLERLDDIDKRARTIDSELANIDLGLAGNARIVANAADPFDTARADRHPGTHQLRKQLGRWQIITESESIKEPRGRSRSQSYSQIALLHSHLFLHDQLTFADISGTDTTCDFSLRAATCRLSLANKHITKLGRIVL